MKTSYYYYEGFFNEWKYKILMGASFCIAVRLLFLPSRSSTIGPSAHDYVSKGKMGVGVSWCVSGCNSEREGVLGRDRAREMGERERERDRERETDRHTENGLGDRLQETAE